MGDVREIRARIDRRLPVPSSGVRASIDRLRDRDCFPSESLSRCVTAAEPTPSDDTDQLTSQGYHITVDDGRDSFFALCIEAQDSEDAWLMSDTVRSLDEMR